MQNTVKWPNGAKCAVMVTFDVDGDLLAKRPVGEEWQWPRSVSYGQYGPTVGLPRLCDLLDDLDIKATFFTPGRTAEKFPEPLRDVASAGHEIGYHGWIHEQTDKLSLPERLEMISRARDALDRIGAKEVVGFRNPAGEFYPEIAQMALDNGFIYSSSMRGDDRPYRTILNGKSSNFIEIPAKFETDDYPYFGYDFYPTESHRQNRIATYAPVFESWKDEFEGHYKYGCCFILMMHPQVIGRPGRIQYLERLLRYMKSFPDVWFATGSEVARWWLDNY